MAFVQAVSAQSTVNVTSITTAAITTTTGNTVAMGGVAKVANTSTSPFISDSKTNTWNAIAGPVSNAATSSLNVYASYSILGTGGASHTFTFTVGTADTIMISGTEFSGRASSSVLDGSNSGADNGGSGAHVTSHTGPSLTTSNAGSDLWFYNGEDDSTGTNTYTAGGSWTAPAAGKQGNSAGWTGFTMYQQNQAAGTYTTAWTTGSATFGAVIVAGFKVGGSSDPVGQICI